MDMPEDEPEAFEIFFHWLYRESLPTPSKLEDLDRLLSLYIFAEKLCTNELRNRTINAIHEMIDILEIFLPFNVEVSTKIWRRVSSTPPLRIFRTFALAIQLHHFIQLHED
ncbi:hypothetical protein sscle_02g012700 [Sclerotinia sclerotiorum 1980 UF-70]|uniref:BTB domain-containing protein n=1 Tax=Sclerotinia sclerotiorum (strain ATCC 18683 / 1980 / Ss-1) TaxID=665079 RepID=A0A1D9PUZ5_SCLS1|nr:hypothetical protein sscle_02g012700 [Sclerotinia sclerotiorum 1980 UF-70]